MATEASTPRRKLSAILMVDVSGFSRMMGRDEEGTTALIREFHTRTRSLVEAHEGRPVEVHDVPLTSGRKLLDVHGTLDELRTRAESLRGAYLRVTLNVPAPAPGLANRVKEILPDALEVRIEYPRLEAPATSEEGAGEPGTDVAAVSTTAADPVQRLEAYYRREHGADLPPVLAELFTRLYEEVMRETA